MSRFDVVHVRAALTWAVHSTWVAFVRVSLPGLVGLLLALAVVSPVYADCINSGRTQLTWCGNYSGCGYLGDIYFAQVATQSGQCHWVTTRQGTGGVCPYVYTTQGGKGNISTGGNPNLESGYHVLSWLTAMENSADCPNSLKQISPTPGCWIQVGWEIGTSQNVKFACNPQQTINASSAEVEVEIYDDSSAPCLLGTFGAAPSNASYDARYYTQAGAFYQYNAYFEVPGSNNIQVLAFADFNSENTAEVATSEMRDDPNSLTGTCPVLGHQALGEWNQFGQQASQPTFASQMQLYQNGAWIDWTSTSPHSTFGYAWPPNGPDINGNGNSSNPYLIQGISNWGAGNFTQWETGGPTGS